MNDDLAALKQFLTDAVLAEDYEMAAILRDRIAALEPQNTKELPPSKLRRQEPGKMGLGTSDQKFRPPEGWKPPKRPDLMTSNTKPRRGGR
jgi:hypothetical protein